MEWEKLSLTLSRLSIEAGKILQFYEKESNLSIQYKDDCSPVTKADTEADAFICNGLREAFPDIPVLSEEGVNNDDRLKHEYCFIVDPLDGTKEFIDGNGDYTVNIALAERGVPIAGAIYWPFGDELYLAIKGRGCFLTVGGKTKEIHVTSRTEHLRVLVSRSHFTGHLKELIDLNQSRVGTIEKRGSSLKGCIIAKGDAEVYYRFGSTNEWDTAAMYAIVVEAGGVMRRMDGTPLLYNQKNVLNSNGFYVLNKIENIFTPV